MATVQTDDQVQISYQVQGEGPTNLILVHGWMVSSAVYNKLAGQLQDVRMIRPDLRGTGSSDKPDGGYSIERYAKDILAVADDVGADKFVIVGHSMGGQVAQWVAATAPQRVQGMILINTVPASGIPLPDEAVGLFRNSAQNRDSQAAILGMACKELSEDDQNALLDDAGQIPAACIQGAFDAWTAGGFADKLGQITAPTLVVATDDPFLPPDFLTGAVVNPIAKARLTYLPGPGHYPLVERTPETASIVHSFLAGLSS